MMAHGPLLLVPALSGLATLSGVVLLVYWAMKHLTAKQQWQTGCLLLIVGLLLPLIMTVFSPKRFYTKDGKGGMQMMKMMPTSGR